MLEAFSMTNDERLRLVIKGQTSRKERKLAKAADADSRIQILIEDQPTDQHLSFVAGCDVCLSPTRWEGLGLPLYESIAFGQPAITNDNAPMNEAVLDGVNGYLVSASVEGTARSGITSWSPDPAELAQAIERIADDGPRAPSSPRARASCARATALGRGRLPATASCCQSSDAGRGRHQVVQPRPARGRPAHALRARLARPRDLRPRTAEEGARPAAGALSRDDVWDQPGVTEASAYDIPLAEYTEWVEREGIEAILCDQNYGFAELAELRGAAACKVIGRFVWEHFTAEHVEGARSAYDVVFSMTRAEQERYREMGLETPYVPWGCHPELIEVGQAVAARTSDPGVDGCRGRRCDFRLHRRLLGSPQAARARARGLAAGQE